MQSSEVPGWHYASELPEWHSVSEVLGWHSATKVPGWHSALCRVLPRHSRTRWVKIENFDQEKVFRFGTLR